MQLTVHDHWLLQTFPQGDAGERSDAEKALPPDLLDALDRARRIQAGQEPMAAAERAVIDAAISDYISTSSYRHELTEAVEALIRLRAAQASHGETEQTIDKQA